MEQKDFDYLLQIRNLKVYFPVKAGIIMDHVIGWIKALDGVDMTIKPMKIVGLVGEPGSGKTTLAKVLLLQEKPTQGEVLFREDRGIRRNQRTLGKHNPSIHPGPYGGVSIRSPSG